jgi:hypothetical protein
VVSIEARRCSGSRASEEGFEVAGDVLEGVEGTEGAGEGVLEGDEQGIAGEDDAGEGGGRQV